MSAEVSSVIDVLPLNYDDTTLKTVVQIDILWLRGRAIALAFEVEHTTSIYSGILRMADLLALQPNMDIKLHIVAPYARKDKVFHRSSATCVFTARSRTAGGELLVHFIRQSPRSHAPAALGAPFRFSPRRVCGEGGVARILHSRPCR